MVLVLGCFARQRDQQHLDSSTPPCRPRPRPTNTSDRSKHSSHKSRLLHRHSSAGSSQSSTRSSTYSNESISRLPPCHRVADPTVEALMMPELPETAMTKSKCLRLSLPKTYSDIVQSMKCEKGCRDWRSFAVFHENDVDETKSADQYALEKRLSFEKRWAQLSSFSSEGNRSDKSVEVDMIC